MNINTVTELTETQKYRGRKAKGSSDRMIASVAAVEKRSGRITRIALWVSTPHQMTFLLAAIMPRLRFDTIQHAVESLGMAMIALSVPIIADLLILNAVETIGAPAIHHKSKVRAFIVLTICASVSGSVNFLAPAPFLVKCLAAFVCAAIVMAESLRDIREDYDKMEAIESDIAVGSTAKAGKRVVSENEMKARKRAGYDQMTAKQKRDWTRNYKPRGPKHPVAQILALTNEAPVSGAPMSA